MKKSILSGKHEYSMDDDFLVFRFGPSPIGVEDVAAMYEIERLVMDRPYVFSLVIFDDRTSIPPGTISCASKTFHKGPPRSTAVVVRKFFLRNAMDFLVRTVRLLGAKLELTFVDNEESAREWIAEQRRKHN